MTPNIKWGARRGHAKYVHLSVPFLLPILLSGHFLSTLLDLASLPRRFCSCCCVFWIVMVIVIVLVSEEADNKDKKSRQNIRRYCWQTKQLWQGCRTLHKMQGQERLLLLLLLLLLRRRQPLLLLLRLRLLPLRLRLLLWLLLPLLLRGGTPDVAAAAVPDVLIEELLRQLVRVLSMLGNKRSKPTPM
jgi:hypothetical protein